MGVAPMVVGTVVVAMTVPMIMIWCRQLCLASSWEERWLVYLPWRKIKVIMFNPRPTQATMRTKTGF